MEASELKTISNVLELRIDNLVLNRNKEVHRFTFMDFMNFRHPNMGSNYGFYSIALTEEWLVKVGFDGNEDERHIVLGLGGGEELSVKLLTKTCCLTRFKKNEQDDFVYIKYPDYVHQLQNLYFALTGQELTISE